MGSFNKCTLYWSLMHRLHHESDEEQSLNHTTVPLTESVCLSSSSHSFLSNRWHAERRKHCKRLQNAPDVQPVLGLLESEWRGGSDEEVVVEEEEDEEVGEGGRELGELPSLLNPAERLHLEGLSVGAPLPVVFVPAAMMVTLQDVLVTTVTGVLVTNPATCSEKTHDKCKLRSLIFQVSEIVQHLKLMCIAGVSNQQPADLSFQPGCLEVYSESQELQCIWNPTDWLGASFEFELTVQPLQ